MDLLHTVASRAAKVSCALDAGMRATAGTVPIAMSHVAIRVIAAMPQRPFWLKLATNPKRRRGSE